MLALSLLSHYQTNYYTDGRTDGIVDINMVAGILKLFFLGLNHAFIALTRKILEARLLGVSITINTLIHFSRTLKRCLVRDFSTSHLLIPTYNIIFYLDENSKT